MRIGKICGKGNEACLASGNGNFLMVVNIKKGDYHAIPTRNAA